MDTIVDLIGGIEIPSITQLKNNNNQYVYNAIRIGHEGIETVEYWQDTSTIELVIYAHIHKINRTKHGLYMNWYIPMSNKYIETFGTPEQTINQLDEHYLIKDKQDARTALIIIIHYLRCKGYDIQ